MRSMVHVLLRSGIVACGLFGALACGSEANFEPTNHSDRARDGGPVRAPSRYDDLVEGLTFAPCPFFTEPNATESAREADAGASLPELPPAECATARLPLHFDDPSGERIEWFVKRVAAESARGQLWLLQGGPGSSGVGLEYLAYELRDEVPDLDIYIPDHRGVGRSTSFECKEALALPIQRESAVAACGSEIERQWGADTRGFRTTNAAHDVLAVATHLRRDAEPVIVWGGSYGAFWAHRVLQVDDEQLVTAAALDSPALGVGGRSLNSQIHGAVEAGDVLFEQCARHDECSSRLGTDPKARALEILNDLCEPFTQRGGRTSLQWVLSAAMEEWRWVRLVPALLYRAERCDPEDIAFWDAFVEQLSPPERTESAEAPRSRAVNLHIAFSEYVNDLSAWSEIERYSETTVFSEVGRALDMATALRDWPLYEPDEHMGRWAAREIPILTLYGGLDVATPPSEGAATAEHFDATQQQSFYFPTGQHGIYYRSHRVEDDDSTTCGKHLTVQFLREPTMQLDADCVGKVTSVDFTASEETLLSIAGHTDPWGNPEAP